MPKWDVEIEYFCQAHQEETRLDVMQWFMEGFFTLMAGNWDI
jgi:hypothetical protein